MDEQRNKGRQWKEHHRTRPPSTGGLLWQRICEEVERLAAEGKIQKAPNDKPEDWLRRQMRLKGKW